VTLAATQDDETAPARLSLRQRAVRGSFWWGLTFPLDKSIQIGSNALLAALLSPQAFGLVALASIVPRGVRMFSEIGIRPAVIQNEREDADFVNTAWTIQVIRGFVVALIAAALAWPFAKFYGEPALGPLILGSAVGSIIGGFQSTSMYTLNRQIHEKPRALLNVSRQALTRTVMIAAALIWPSAWALVIGNLVGGVFHTGVSHTLMPTGRNRFRLETDAVRSLISFGKWIFVGSIIAFLAREMDKLVLGKLVHEQMEIMGVVGVYVIAQRIGRVPSETVQQLAGQMAFPAMAEIARNAPNQFARRVRQIREVILAPAVALCLVVVFVAPIFFELLYDDRYAAAQWMAPLITLPVWIGLLNNQVNRALLALGRPKPLAFTGGLKVAVSLVTGLAGFYLFGVAGFIVGMAMGGLVKHLVESLMLRQHDVRLFGQDLALSAIFLTTAGVGAVSMYYGQAATSTTVRVLLQGTVPGLLLLGTGLWAGRKVWPVVFKR